MPRLKKRDSKAQELIYKHYANVWYGICRRYLSHNDDIKDVMQDICIKIFASVDKFSGNGNFEGWMHRVAVNVILDYIRKNKKSAVIRISDAEEFDNIADDAELISDEFANWYSNCSYDEMLRIIASIPEQYRIVFNMHLDNYSHEQIAQTLSISEMNSKTRLKRARQALRAEFERSFTTVQTVKYQGL